MSVFYTVFRAIDRTDGILKTWEGNFIHADSFEEADEYCRKYAPFLVVVGELNGIVTDELSQELFEADIKTNHLTPNLN